MFVFFGQILYFVRYSQEVNTNYRVNISLQYML